MPRVKMPDGKTVFFPDSMGRDEMKAAANKYIKNIKPQEVDPEPDYWRGVAQATGGAIGGIAAGGLAAVDPIPGDEPIAFAAGSAAGSAIGGQAYDAGKALYEWATGGDAGQTVAGQTLRAAEDFAIDLALPPLAGRAFSAIGTAGKAALSPIKTAAASKIGPIGAQTVQQVERAAEAGFQPTIGMIDNPGAQTLYQSLRAMPGATDLIAQADRQNLKAGLELADNVAREYGTPLAGSEAGAMIRREAQAAGDRFHKGAEYLFDKVAEFLGDTVPANNTKTVIEEVMGRAQGDELASKYLAESVDLARRAASNIAEDGSIPVDTLKTVKKLASGVYKKAETLRTDSDRFIIQLERAASRDLNDEAVRVGGKEAENAVSRANEWWKAGKGNPRAGDIGLMDDVATILKQSEDGKIYTWLKSEAKDGDAKLERVLGMVDDSAAGDIKASIFREMGEATPGAQGAFGSDFSFNTFLTNWNKLSDSANQTLFGKASKNMQTLLENAEFQKALERQANVSGTARVSNFVNVLLKPIGDGLARGGVGGIAGAARGATAGLVGSAANVLTARQTAQLVTDPDFIKWLANTSRKVIVKPTDMAPQIARLAVYANRSPEKAELYTKYINELGYDTKKVTTSRGKTTVEVQ